MRRKLTSTEAASELKQSHFLQYAVVEGSLVIEGDPQFNVILENVVVRGNLIIRGTVHMLHISKVSVEGGLHLDGMRIEGGLYIIETTVGRIVGLLGTLVCKELDLGGLEVPVIHVDRKLAELVHYAAPTIPLRITL